MSPKNDADLERYEEEIDLLSEGAGLKTRLEHYEGHLKNGSQDDRKAIARGVSALLAASVETSKKLDLVATRTEVRDMIAAHATTCALARSADADDDDDAISILGGKVGAKGRFAVKALATVASLLLILLLVALPYANGLIQAWRGTAARAEVAAKKAEEAVVVTVENQDQAQRDRDAMMAMMRTVLQEIRSEAQK